MKTILDLFGNFSKNEMELHAAREYLKIITTILASDMSLKKRLIKDINNYSLMMDSRGEEDIASELRKFLGLLS